MADVIQCPTCSKKFKLPDRPPAVFTCTSCGTAMDLSAFRAAAPAAAAPAAAEASAAPASSGSSSGRSGRSSRSGSSARGSRSSGSSRPARGAAASRSRRGQEEDDDGEGGRGAPPPKKSNALLIGSLIGFVVIIGIAFLAMRSGKRKDGEVAKGPGTTAPVAAPAPAPEPAMATEAPPAEEPKVVPKGGFHVVDHNPDTTPEERQKIDDLVNKAVFENSGSDSRAAGHELVGLGMKAAPRIINAFTTIKNGEGFDSQQGRIKAGVADQLLRKIDGFMEKKKKIKTTIKATSDTKWAESTAKTWIAWWDSGTWKHPEKPYDPRYDDNPDAPPAMSEEPAPMSEPAPMGEGDGGMEDK